MIHKSAPLGERATAAIEYAQAAIARELRELEEIVGRNVAAISFNDIDITTLESPESEVLREVVIEFHLPRSVKWSSEI